MPKRSIRALIGSAALLTAGGLALADWPQWRGANRDARTELTVPQTWPKELKAKWKQAVGTGDSTPALVGDKLYAFSRQDDNEVTSCLDANTGKDHLAGQIPGGASDRPRSGTSRATKLANSGGRKSRDVRRRRRPFMSGRCERQSPLAQGIDQRFLDGSAALPHGDVAAGRGGDVHCATLAAMEKARSIAFDLNYRKSEMEMGGR